MSTLDPCLPLRKRSRVRLLPAADFNPQVNLCSSERGRWRRGGSDCCRPTCPGQEVSSCPLCCGGSLWPPGPRARWEVRSQQASTTGRNGTRGLRVSAARPAGSPATWQVTAAAGEQRRARRAAPARCPTARFPHGKLFTPLGKQRGAHETVTLYPDLQSCAEQL